MSASLSEIDASKAQLECAKLKVDVNSRLDAIVGVADRLQEQQTVTEEALKDIRTNVELAWDSVKAILAIAQGVPKERHRPQATAAGPPIKMMSLLRNWKDQITLNLREHDRRASFLRKMFYMGGIGCAVLSGGATASAYTGYSDSVNVRAINLVVGTISLAFFILNAVNMYLDLGSKSTAHHTSGVAYDALIRFIDSIESSWDAESDDAKTVLASVRSQFDEVVRNSAPLPLEKRVSTLSTELINPHDAKGAYVIDVGSISDALDLPSHVASRDTTPGSAPTRGGITGQCKVRETLQQKQTESKLERKKTEGFTELMRYQIQRLAMTESGDRDRELVEV